MSNQRQIQRRKRDPNMRWLMVLVAFAFLAVPADRVIADFEFSPPRTLSDRGTRPGVIVDSRDRATVVWASEVGIEAVRLDADGNPGPVRTLASLPDFGNPKGCRCPRLAVDDLDRVTVAWQAFDGTDLRIQAVQVGPDGGLGTVRTLSAVGIDAWNQRLAIDSKGRVTVVWHLSGPMNQIQSVRLNPGGALEAVQTLSEPTVNSTHPKVAIDPHDRTTVVWDSDEGVQAIRLDADHTPGSIQTLSSVGEDAGPSRVVVDSQGRATVVWWRCCGIYEVKAVRLGTDGVPGPVLPLSPEDQNTLDPLIGIDPQDRVTVTWQTFASEVYAVRLGADGVPGSVRLLSNPDRRAGEPQLAAGHDGRVVVAWAHPAVGGIIPAPGECLDGDGFEPGSDFVRAVFIGSDGAPGPVHPVSAMGEQSAGPAVALDSQSRPTVVWTSFDGTFFCSDVGPRIQLSRGIETVGAQPPIPADNEPPDRAHAAPPRSGTALRLGRRAVIRGKWGALFGACMGDQGAICAGAIRLVARPPFGAKGRPRSTGQSLNRMNDGLVMLRRGCYRLAAGKHRVLALRLTWHGRRLIDRIASRRTRFQAITEGNGVERRVVSLVAPERFFFHRLRRTHTASFVEGRPALRNRHACPRTTANPKLRH